MLSEKQLTKISKRLSLVLRHQPQLIGVQLDEQGWVNVEELLAGFSQHFFTLTLAELEEVVANNNKKRFAFDETGQQIRASQGHSVSIDLNYEPQEPPEFLYHGTATRFLEAIRKEGLSRQKRHHVHLSADEETARNVGSRHGKPVVLRVNAAALHTQGQAFFISENGVWLTEAVLPEFLLFPEEEE